MNKPNWPGLPSGDYIGALVDEDIKEAIDKALLVHEGSPDQAKYACYELRIGPGVQQLVLDRNTDERNDLYRGKEINEDGSFQIYPGETFKIVAAEKLHMPADVFAIVVPVGNLYRLGLSPETTFADPGYSREFFVTINNFSPRIVTLKVGDPLSRVFFFKLHKRPTRIHEGEPRDMPPTVKRVAKPEMADLKRRGASALLEEVLKDVDPPHYQHAVVTAEFLALRRNLAVATVFSYSAFLVVVIGVISVACYLLRKDSPSLWDGVLSNAIYGLIVLLLSLVWTPVRHAVLDALRALARRREE